MIHIAFCCLSILLLLPVLSSAESAIICHCFTDRSYNPSKPVLADPYFLASAQNSFFAALFGVDKKIIVVKKQSGSSADGLWIAYWLASKSGRSAEALLAVMQKSKSWKVALATMGIPEKSIGEPFASEIVGGASEERLSQLIVDAALIRHRLLGEQELAAMRKERASSQEVIITSLITAKAKRPAILIYREVKRGANSWGRLLHEANIQAPAFQSEFAALLK